MTAFRVVEKVELIKAMSWLSTTVVTLFLTMLSTWLKIDGGTFSVEVAETSKVD